MQNKTYPFELRWSFNGRITGTKKAPSDFETELTKAIKRWKQKDQLSGVTLTKIALHSDHQGQFENGVVKVGRTELAIVYDDMVRPRNFALRGNVDT